MGIISEEPVLSRLDRLDNMLKQLEEIRGCNRSPATPRSSCASTPSSGTLTSTEGHPSSVDLSPRGLERHCRPMDHVMMETKVKGTLIDRLDQAEGRLIKLCSQLEEELEAERKKKKGENNIDKKPAHKKGIKQLVKQCVTGKHSQHRARTLDLKS